MSFKNFLVGKRPLIPPLQKIAAEVSGYFYDQKKQGDTG
nr:MAG TPA: hypothetical protein [Caudoviricetes sp.]